MANVDTPGYKTQGFDFEQEMARQLNGDAGSGWPETQVTAEESMDWWRGRMETTCRWIAKDCSWRSRSCSFAWGSSLLKHEFSGVMSAIHAEAK